MFSEGVNSASVIDGEPPATELHTELGHIWARPFRADGGLHPDQSGCRIHKQCFEGFASSTRIFKTWNQGIETDFKNLPQDAHETIAFYIAQMCMNIVLANAPARILLGGKTVFPELIPLIKQYFKHFNDGGTGESYLNYAAMHLPDFIRMAAIDHKKASLEGALELARRVVDNPGLALKTSARPSHTSGS
jgi:predicted NBD/HSP70 family sugar kinase